MKKAKDYHHTEPLWAFHDNYGFPNRKIDPLLFVFAEKISAIFILDARF